MTTTSIPYSSNPWSRRLKRLGLLVGIPLFLGLILLVLLWRTFFKYVPPGKMMIIIAKSGAPLEEGQVLARPGQKGVLADVRGEGWHFVMPIAYTVEFKDNQVVRPGNVGIVTSLTGTLLPKGRDLAEDGEQGIRREILLPGTYRLNTYGYTVTEVPMVQVKAGFVGVKRRKLIAKSGEPAGIQKEVLVPGIYPINTREFEVVSCDVGIYQTTFRADQDTRKEISAKPSEMKDGIIAFPDKDANIIALDCTVEWELKPEHWPGWLSKYETMKQIERVVVQQHAQKICRDQGAHYKTQEFLEGAAREKFQEAFRAELDKVCMRENVIVRSAFIRNIIIPDDFLEQKRLKALAEETEITTVEKTKTATTEKEVAKAKQLVDQAKQKVQAETEKLVETIEQEVKTLKDVTRAELERMRDENAALVAIIEAQRKEELGKAEAEAKRLKDTAEASIYKLKMEVFNRDADAYLRYTMAEKLNPNMKLRLFQSGPGTLWTNMGDKSMNLMFPLPGADKTKVTPEK